MSTRRQSNGRYQMKKAMRRGRMKANYKRRKNKQTPDFLIGLVLSIIFLSITMFIYDFYLLLQ
jgi:hypothetical protein